MHGIIFNITFTPRKLHARKIAFFGISHGMPGISLFLSILFGIFFLKKLKIH